MVAVLKRSSSLITNPSFNRIGLLAGQATLDALQKTRVILFGVGGVGSWCAEALIRSGVGTLTMVDSDLICQTNINRQVQATTKTIGCVKVAELARRLHEINPDATIEARQEIYERDGAVEYHLNTFNYVIDAIDSLSAKVDLIITASQAGATVYSALGASCKIDPSRIRISSIWESHGCRLGKFVRKRLRKRGFTGELPCIFSDELLPPQENSLGCGSGTCICPESVAVSEAEEDAMIHEWCSKKKQINGSAVHITGIYGFMLAGMVIQEVKARVDKNTPVDGPVV